MDLSALNTSQNSVLELFPIIYRQRYFNPGVEPPQGFETFDISPKRKNHNNLPIYSIALDLSGNCNLACRYCAEEASQPKRTPMTTETLKKAIQLLEIDQNNSTIRPSIRIGSGEPLLSKSLLKELQAHLGELDAPIDVFLTTNGTLIDEDTAKWLASTGWKIKISLDGPKSIHDFWRLDRSGNPTHDKVIAAIKLLMKLCPDQISVAAVLCRAADPETVFQEIESLGVKRIELVPVASRANGGSLDPSLSSDDVRKYFDFLVRYAKRIIDGEVNSIPKLVRFEESLHRLLGYGNTIYSCGAGRSFVCVDGAGELYPCFRFAGVDDYRLGHVQTGFYREAKSFFANQGGRSVDDRPSCNGCWAKYICGGPCFSVAEFFGPGNGAPIPEHCSYKLVDIRVALWLAMILRDNDIEKLADLLPVNV